MSIRNLTDEFRETCDAFNKTMHRSTTRTQYMEPVARDNQGKIAALITQQMEFEKEILGRTTRSSMDIYNEIMPEDKTGFELTKEEIIEHGAEIRSERLLNFHKKLISDYEEKTVLRDATQKEYEAGILYVLPNTYSEIIGFLSPFV